MSFISNDTQIINVFYNTKKRRDPTGKDPFLGNLTVDDDTILIDNVKINRFWFKIPSIWKNSQKQPTKIILRNCFSVRQEVQIGVPFEFKFYSKNPSNNKWASVGEAVWFASVIYRPTDNLDTIIEKFNDKCCNFIDDVKNNLEIDIYPGDFCFHILHLPDNTLTIGLYNGSSGWGRWPIGVQPIQFRNVRINYRIITRVAAGPASEAFFGKEFFDILDNTWKWDLEDIDDEESWMYLLTYPNWRMHEFYLTSSLSEYDQYNFLSYTRKEQFQSKKFTILSNSDRFWIDVYDGNTEEPIDIRKCWAWICLEFQIKIKSS